MTREVQAVYTVTVRGHIDGGSGEWEQKIFERVSREMQLQFGQAARVTKAFAESYGHRGNSMVEALTDANGHPIKRGADVDCCPSCGVSAGWIGPPDSSHCPDKWHGGM
jgi:hypothetical protein